jgi:predicted glycosyl hydrolase (DUF1957 family)
MSEFKKTIIHEQKNSCDILHSTSDKDSMSFKYTSRPAVWGSKFWYILHNGSVHYPEKPSKLAIERTYGFLKSIPYFLPCGDCRNHAIDFINSIPEYTFRNHLSSRKNLVSFLVLFHNTVNARSGKSSFPEELVYDNIEKK